MLNKKSSILVLIAVILALTSQSHSKTVRYTLDVFYFFGSPDGIHKDKILGINGEFPGPTLEAHVGDTLEVTLINSIQDGQNTTIHWHGISQHRSLFEDGTAQISQCPLPVGKSQVYKFNVTRPGTFWYHSHVNSQYTEGMFGALLVHSHSEAYQYDGEMTVLVSDWYHRTAHDNENWHLSAAAKGVPPYPESGLINGMGRYPCNYAVLQKRGCDTNKQMRQVFRLQRDKTYRVRLINAAAVSAFNFSIDGHSLKTIEVDGIDVAEPVTADIASITAGQRYSFLLKCKAVSTKDSTRHLIRANLRKESLMLIEGENINKYPEALMGEVTAVVECVNDDLSNFAKNAIITKEVFTCDEIIPPPAVLQQEYLDEMKLAPRDGVPAPDFFDEEYVVNADFRKDREGIRRGSFNGTPFSLPHDKPILMKVLDGERLSKFQFPIEINYGSVVQLVINNPFFGPHPFHLHGHHFWILGMGEWYDGDYDPARHNLTIHGVKRDTVLVQEKSWAVIRFVADNPGVWTFHCHIDWHNLSGMALTFIEGVDIIRKEVKVTDEALRVCRMHTETDRNFTSSSLQYDP